MFRYQYFLLVLALTAAVHSSPTNTEDVAPTNLEEISKQEGTSVLDDKYSVENNEPVQGQRRKRWYNFYGFPPAPIYLNPARDTATNFGADDPLVFIHRRLQEIANVARQPPPPPAPVFLPVIFVPQVCNCKTKSKKNQTDSKLPEVESRFPEMEDTRQNWGFPLNDTDYIDSDDGDGSRPISFDPIVPSKPVRPAPPVEHGSKQAGLGLQGSTTGQGTTAGQVTTAGPVIQTPELSQIPDKPSVCDGAVLKCCHQPHARYDCFVAEGCPNPTSYGNPCDTKVILNVVQRFQRFYGQRTK